jgi:hypothetical protein
VTTAPEWEPGSSAFWLDPHLWDRTPYVDGRLEPCWMHLDSPVTIRWYVDRPDDPRYEWVKCTELHYAGRVCRTCHGEGFYWGLPSCPTCGRWHTPWCADR